MNSINPRCPYDLPLVVVTLDDGRLVLACVQDDFADEPEAGILHVQFLDEHGRPRESCDVPIRRVAPAAPSGSPDSPYQHCGEANPSHSGSAKSTK